ncbi:MAG: acetylglutamate kinase [Euryarchaeota archaeon]|nr:acetylglutamate kinase [Euryarchaeota archaeon]
MMKTLVLKLGGAVALEEETIDHLVAGLRPLQEAGVRTILVHGAGPQIDRALSESGEAPIKHKGLRVTSTVAAEVVRRELDTVGSELAKRLTQKGLHAMQVPSAAGVYRAEKKVLDDGFDLGRVGTVTDIRIPSTDDDVLGMDRLFTEEGGPVLVITPVGSDDAGPLNINADEAASALAKAVGADRLLLATDVPHVRDQNGDPVPSLDRDTCKALLASGAAKGGMMPKLEAALFALDAGVKDVLITKLGPETLARALEAVPSHGTWLTVKSSAAEAMA